MSRAQKLLLFGTLLQLCWVLTSAALDSGTGPDAVLKLFPGYHLLTIAERDSGARDFIQENQPKQNPSIIHADFDGDGHLDYALLLKSDQSQNAKFVILLCPNDDSCKQVFVLDLSGSSSIMYLRKLAPSSRVSQTVEGQDPSSPVRLTGTGIELNYFGKAAVVYYWDKGLKKIASVQTED